VIKFFYLFLLGILASNTLAQVDTLSSKIQTNTVEEFSIVNNNVDSTIQVKDTIKPLVKAKFKPIPRKAFLWSLIPGGGQIYNRKYWYIKLPIIYAGLGFGIKVISDNTKGYKQFRDLYFNKVNKISDPSPLIKLDESILKRNRDAFQKNLQYSYLGTFLGWMLVSLEAYTTAHLMEFNVSDDLSMKIQPVVPTVGIANGIGIHVSMSW
jgi:Family of unknown function (DUF5683)